VQQVNWQGTVSEDVRLSVDHSFVVPHLVFVFAQVAHPAYILDVVHPENTILVGVYQYLVDPNALTEDCVP
jgi:hypothetical protein